MQSWNNTDICAIVNCVFVLKISTKFILEISDTHCVINLTKTTIFGTNPPLRIEKPEHFSLEQRNRIATNQKIAIFTIFPNTDK